MVGHVAWPLVRPRTVALLLLSTFQVFAGSLWSPPSKALPSAGAISGVHPRSVLSRSIEGPRRRMGHDSTACQAVVEPDHIVLLSSTSDLRALSALNQIREASMVAVADSATFDYKSILAKASKRAIGGGASGAFAGVAQVLTLMWLRTAMNYQYRYGTSTPEAFDKLWKEGGVRRFYRGVGYALVQNPLSRFGDTAANAGILAILEATPETQKLPFPVKQALASIAASSWRIVITPVDTLKTTLQVEGNEALQKLRKKVELGGVGVLWNGAFAAAAATFVGNYPWFLTYNALDSTLPSVPDDDLLATLVRRALIGIVASGVSDTVSNSLRVVKTTKQTSEIPISYLDAVNEIIAKDGIPGLLGRGLKLRLLVNCLQGGLFSVAWKAAEKKLLM